MPRKSAPRPTSPTATQAPLDPNVSFPVGRALLPSDLLALARAGYVPDSPVALDTETSGLHVDAGARISTVSVGWLDFNHRWVDPHSKARDRQGREQFLTDSAIYTWGYEKVEPIVPIFLNDAPPLPSRDVPVVSMAWPFDQDVEGTGKPEDKGTFGLWSETDNLPRSEFEALLEWIRIVGPIVGLDFHNAKFDMHQTQAGCRRWPDLTLVTLPYLRWDTQNGADLLWGFRNGGTSLKPNSKALWGGTESDEQAIIKRYLKKRKLPSGRWDLMPWSIVARYADQDARLTARMAFLQEHIIRNNTTNWLPGQEMFDAFQRRMQVTRMLYRVERRGLPFNVKGALEADAQIQLRIRDHERLLPFSPATLPMAKHYWFGEGVVKGVKGLNMTPYDTTETGGPKLDQQIVDKMVAAGRPGAEVWKEITQLQDASSRWYAGWASRAGADDRLRTSVRQNGTVSGRFSVENIQLQAIPHDYKLSDNAALVGIPTPRRLINEGVPPGFEMWELDLAQAELRVAAEFAQCARMLRLIHEGADLHSDTATALFDIHENHHDWDEMRTVAKRANFSLIFGVGWETFAEQVEKHAGVVFNERESRTLIRDWNLLYPEYKREIRRTMETIETRQRGRTYGPGYGWINLANGERRWFRPGEDTHKGFNQRVQGSLAQYAMDMWMEAEALVDSRLSPDERAMGAGMILMVHDSMVLLLPEGGRGEQIVEDVRTLAAAIWQRWFPGLPGGLDAKRWAKKS